MNNELMEHCNEVAEIAMDIALEMKLCPFYIAQIGLAAIYHDIGKEYIPNSILNKPGKLTEDEQQMMIAHTYIGHWMIKVGETDLADMISEVVLHHHENYDGSGYYSKRMMKYHWQLGLFTLPMCFPHSRLTERIVLLGIWTKQSVMSERTTEYCSTPML